jgi:tetratricopeptide (TPR) repeat protein
MARTRLGMFTIGLVGLVLTAAPVRADDKALQKQLDELNVLTGGDPTSGALRGLVSDPKQLKELLEFAAPKAKKKEISYNAALVLGLAAADSKDLKTAEVFFRVCMDQAAKLQSLDKLDQSYLTLAEYYRVHRQYANESRIYRELLELNTNDGKERLVIGTTSDPKGAVDFGDPQEGFDLVKPVWTYVTQLNIKAMAKAGKHDQAMKQIENLAKQVAPWRVNHLKGFVLNEAGKLDAAAGLLEGVIKQVARDENIEPTVRDKFIESVHAEVSNIYIELKKIDRATEHLEFLVKKYPGKATYYNDLGYVWADNDMKLDEAEKLIRKALDLDREERKNNENFNPKTDHDNGAYLDSLGWVLFKRKKNVEAKEWLLKAVADKSTQHIEIFDHLGDVCMALGEREEAIRAYERGLEHVTETRRDQLLKAAVEKKLEKLKSSK